MLSHQSSTSDSECLELSSLQTSVSKSILPTSVRLIASTIFVDLDIFGGCSPRSLRRHSSTPSLTLRVDYCNFGLAGVPKVVLQETEMCDECSSPQPRVLTGTRKFNGGLPQLMHDNLHWLDVPERVNWHVAASSVPRIGNNEFQQVRQVALEKWY